jgi:hypothetical protein
MNNTNNSKSLLSDIFAKNRYSVLNLVHSAKGIPDLLNYLLLANESEQVNFFYKRLQLLMTLLLSLGNFVKIVQFL